VVQLLLLCVLGFWPWPYIYLSTYHRAKGGAAVAAVCAGVLALALHHCHLPPSSLPLPAHQDLPHSQVNISNLLPLILLFCHRPLVICSIQKNLSLNSVNNFLQLF
jgi:hypothetical protein